METRRHYAHHLHHCARQHCLGVLERIDFIGTGLLPQVVVLDEEVARRMKICDSLFDDRHLLVCLCTLVLRCNELGFEISFRRRLVCNALHVLGASLLAVFHQLGVVFLASLFCIFHVLHVHLELMDDRIHHSHDTTLLFLSGCLSLTVVVINFQFITSTSVGPDLSKAGSLEQTTLRCGLLLNKRCSSIELC